ncbi:MAG: GNAT family N-acetyltransferase [Alphaproteobacteria bacterium]|nr:GNAT family N-acetyltransferase [Alphaproteobacteria bacterium]MCW5739246.1 GNAT family N-acetyltransferase [Alphaproteobacteria bacterium]
MVDATRFAGERPVLTTGRLVLRQPSDGDIPAIIDIVGDLRVARQLARIPHPYGEADARFFLDEIVPRELVWALALRSSARLVGMAGLTPTDDGDVAELGYYLAPALWGRGLATEATGAILDYGFAVGGFTSITAGHFAGNPASARVLGKLGFVEIGRADRFCLATGLTEPSIELRLDRR